MTRKKEDRRIIIEPPEFPLFDNEGNIISAERRNGKDRRKNSLGNDIAREIIDLLD